MVENLTYHLVEIAKLIGKFQVLELGLKVIVVKHEIAEDKNNNKLKTSYSIDHVDELSYGILLKRYARACENSEFSDRLLLLKDTRNFLAHKSIAAISGLSEEMKVFVRVGGQPLDYPTINKELNECIEILTNNHKSDGTKLGLV